MGEVRLARVSRYAVEAARVDQDAADPDECGRVGLEAAAVSADLDLGGEGDACLAGGFGDAPGLFGAVRQESQSDTAAQRCEDARQLVGVDADGVGEVGVAAVGPRGGCPTSHRPCEVGGGQDVTSYGKVFAATAGLAGQPVKRVAKVPPALRADGAAFATRFRLVGYHL